MKSKANNNNKTETNEYENRIIVNDEKKLILPLQTPNIKDNSNYIQNKHRIFSNINIDFYSIAYKLTILAVVLFTVFIILMLAISLSNNYIELSDLSFNQQPIVENLTFDNKQALNENEFISKIKEAESNSNIIIETNQIEGGISQVSAYTEDYYYEINFITFESTEDANFYFDYVIENSEPLSESAQNYSYISGVNYIESTFISDKYSGFVDISSIENTIIIGIAYNSNYKEHIKTVINNLGY